MKSTGPGENRFTAVDVGKIALCQKRSPEKHTLQPYQYQKSAITLFVKQDRTVTLDFKSSCMANCDAIFDRRRFVTRGRQICARVPPPRNNKGCSEFYSHIF